MTDAGEILRPLSKRNAMSQGDAAYSLFRVSNIHLPILPVERRSPPRIRALPGGITALGNAESLFQHYRRGMYGPLVPRVVRSACPTEPLISGESTAKVPEACHPFSSFSRNQALRLPCTRISSQSAEICDRSAHLANQQARTYSRRTYCNIFPLSPGDPYANLLQTVIVADSESPNSDSRGSTLARQVAILQRGRITFRSHPEADKEISIIVGTHLRLNSSCKQHNKPTLISPQDGTHHTQCHVMLQQQTAATAAPALHTSIALRTPNPANKGQYDG